MTTSKTTYRSALTYAIENLSDAPAEVIEKLEAMIAQLDKKNAAPKKLTAKQEANEVVKDILREFLEIHSDSGFTCSDLIKSVPALEGKTPQYVSALLRALLLTNEVEKYTENRRTYFRAVVEG